MFVVVFVCNNCNVLYCYLLACLFVGGGCLRLLVVRLFLFLLFAIACFVCSCLSLFFFFCDCVFCVGLMYSFVLLFLMCVLCCCCVLSVVV